MAQNSERLQAKNLSYEHLGRVIEVYDPDASFRVQGLISQITHSAERVTVKVQLGIAEITQPFGPAAAVTLLTVVPGE